jgi:acetolactate synthase small subunit
MNLTSQTTQYKVNTKVQNGLGVLARITILLRKFNVTIQSIKTIPLKNEKNFYNIKLLLETNKSPRGFSLVMKKLERLVPVVEVAYEKLGE